MSSYYEGTTKVYKLRFSTFSNGNHLKAAIYCYYISTHLKDKWKKLPLSNSWDSLNLTKEQGKELLKEMKSWTPSIENTGVKALIEELKRKRQQERDLFN